MTTIGDLKRIIANLHEDTPVVVLWCGGEYDYQDPTNIHTAMIEWHEADPDDDDENGVPDRYCLVIE